MTGPPVFKSRPPKPTVRIFCDFDGTIVQEDVGEALFRHFCGDAAFDRIRAQWQQGAMSAPEAYGAFCDAAAGLTEETLHTFLEPFAIDASFVRFVSWCGERNYPLLVLSDGADRYIERLFARAGVSVPFRSNRLTFDDGKPAMAFPHFDRRCPEIAHCKSNHVALESSDEDLIVYVGDGSSDFEAAQYADMVFARGALELYCQEQNITFRRFYSFTTVREVLSLMISQKKLRKRKRAEIRRQQLWMSG